MRQDPWQETDGIQHLPSRNVKAKTIDSSQPGGLVAAYVAFRDKMLPELQPDPLLLVAAPPSHLSV